MNELAIDKYEGAPIVNDRDSLALLEAKISFLGLADSEIDEFFAWLTEVFAKND